MLQFVKTPHNNLPSSSSCPIIYSFAAHKSCRIKVKHFLFRTTHKDTIQERSQRTTTQERKKIESEEWKKSPSGVKSPEGQIEFNQKIQQQCSGGEAEASAKDQQQQEKLTHLFRSGFPSRGPAAWIERKPSRGKREGMHKAAFARRRRVWKWMCENAFILSGFPWLHDRNNVGMPSV